MNGNMKIKIKCTDCGYELPDKWAHSNRSDNCPGCNSINQTIEIGVFEEIGVELHDNVQGKVKNRSYSSKKNPRYEFFEGDDFRKRDRKWMMKTRIIDKDRDKYVEKVIDPETGEIVHEKEEPLSDHFGHGSAKFNKKRDA